MQIREQITKWAGGRNEAVRRKMWLANQYFPSAPALSGTQSCRSLTPLGFLHHWRAGAVELSLSHVGPRLGAAGNRGALALELLLQPKQQGTLPPPSVALPPSCAPPPSGLRGLLQGHHLCPPVPAHRGQS